MTANPKTPLILVVDDDMTTTRLLEQILQRAGFDTCCAHNLADAEALARLTPFSLTLLDVHLPDGNGLDLCEKLAADPLTEGMPILLISANNDVSVKVRGFASGAVDYITKPLAGAEVLARVRTHLRLRSAYASLVELQAERVQRLAASQKCLMPLPSDYPEAGFHVCMWQALQAGGDFYDVVPTGSQTIDYVVADASGHDLGVALWTASFKTLLSQYVSVLHTPQAICRMINDSLRPILPEMNYFTAIYARLNRTSGKLSLVNAGHPPAILASARTRQTVILEQEGDVIGIFPDPVFGLLEVPVQPGDRLFLYSDGLIEGVGSRDQGLVRMKEACRREADHPLEHAVGSIVSKLCSGPDPGDDIVLLGVEV